MKKLLGEFKPQKGIVVLLPYRKDIWRENALPAQKMIISLVNAIAEFEPVYLGVIPHLVEFIKYNFKIHNNVNIVSIEYNDSWARDTLSSVLVDGDDRVVNAFGFNAYGTPLYEPFDSDQCLNRKVFGKIFKYPIQDIPLTLEWGNIMPDGNGTIFVVEDSIVNDNRNPGKTKEEVEQILLDKTGSSKVVWIPYGLDYDETGGHIDNILSFADEHTILLSFTDNEENVHYKKTHELYSLLVQCTNAFGEKYKIIKLPVPNVGIRNATDSNKVKINSVSVPRKEGDIILYTYVNFTTVNGAIILPKFNIADDERAKLIVEQAFPNRKIIQIDAHEAFLGGGGFHCLTKHIN